MTKQSQSSSIFHGAEGEGQAYSKTVFINRYKNRKLYSKTLRTYVTLSDIRDIIKSGKSVRVTDDENNDITSQTLGQVLVSAGNVPVSLLSYLIGNN